MREMLESARAETVLQILDEFAPYTPSARKSSTAYRCLIGTILSAQSTGKQTLTAAKSLFAMADDPVSMIELGEINIQELIKVVGLWRNKAKAIYRTSIALIERHDGKVPADLEALCALPGVGLKTASIVMSFYFGLPAMAVDTHIFRCARRWGLSKGKTATKVAKDLMTLYPADLRQKLHVQIITFARKYCKARNHSIVSCPMCRWAYVPGGEVEKAPTLKAPKQNRY